MEVLELEKNLKKYKDAELDIEILERKNEKLCEENNIEIRKLKEARDKIEINLEADLKKSKLEKQECRFGDYVGTISFKKMPDKWIYIDEILMSWIISLPAKLKNLYLKVTTTVKKGDLKKQIIADNFVLFEKNKLIEDDAEIELFIVEGERDIDAILHKVEGIEIKHQDPRFSITIKKKK